MRYSELVGLYKQLESTTKRLEKTFYIAEFLKKHPEEIDIVILLVQGRVFPSWSEEKIGIASKLIIKAINLATGVSQEEIEESWSKRGDLGEACKEFAARKRQTTLMVRELDVRKVFQNLQKLASTEGEGSVDRKIGLVAELLTSAKPEEAKYIVRNVLEELRVGVGDGILRDAIVFAFITPDAVYNKTENQFELDEQEGYNNSLEIIQEAYDITNDLSRVANIAAKHGLEGLKNITIDPGKPLKVMLFQKAVDIKDAFNRVGKPCALEYKMDGFRIQIHKANDRIALFTRRLESVTAQFPDIIEFIERNIAGESFVIDAEAVGYDTESGGYLPFQNISQRIKRKHDIHAMARKFPVEVNIFDILYHNGRTLIKTPFTERRKLLEEVIKQKPKEIVLVRNIITSDIKEAEVFYEESLAKGNEGIMAKKLDAVYKPGSRVGYGVKIKPIMDSLDLAVIGAEWGEGKRAGWLTSFTLACINENNEFLEIGKVGTGIKEKEEGASFEKLTAMLKPLITAESGREVRVKPEIVLEVHYEEIQKSPTYSSGYALRFPRLVQIREDKSAEEASSMEYVEELYFGQ